MDFHTSAKRPLHSVARFRGGGRPRVIVCKWYLAEKRMSVRNRYGIVRDLSGRDVGQEGGMGAWRGQVSSNVAQWLSATSSLVLFFIIP
jgi:hypothetical protein